MKLFKIPYCFTAINNTSRAVIQSVLDCEDAEMRISHLTDNLTAYKLIKEARETARKESMESCRTYEDCLKECISDIRRKLMAGSIK